MALVSMTGFGRGEASAGGIKIEVELGSVNRKQFDLRFNLPRSLMVLESRIHTLIHNSLDRGYVTGNLNLSVTSQARRKQVVVDAAVASAWTGALRRTAKELGLKDDLTARSLLQLPQVFEMADAAVGAEQVWPLVEKALAQALERMTAMRRKEGRHIQADLTQRFKGLAAVAGRIRKQAPLVAQQYAAGLRERLAKSGVALDLDDPRLLKELALFADRCDISEEMVRLDSHFQQAKAMMDSGKPAGRSLDFLCQEMFREINTTGSKANNALISQAVIQFKTELESVREQVQNVE